VTKIVNPAEPTKTSQPITKQLVAAVHPDPSLIEEISDLLDNLPLKACVELTGRLLTAVPTLRSGAARPRAVLKIDILYISQYGSTAYTNDD
jgi:hypothetical protein